MTLVTLPGGRHTPAGLLRRVRLAPATGELELLLADAAIQPQPWSEFGPRLLSLACSDADGTPWREADAAALCLGDRQFLLLRLAAALWGEQTWLNADCQHCGARFDLPLDRRAVPVHPAGASYPWVDLRLPGSETPLRLRLPDATDEQALAIGAGPQAARAAGGAAALGLDRPEDLVSAASLVQRCLVEVDGRPPTGDEALRWDVEALAAIDAAMDAVAPAVADVLLTTCPACDHTQQLRFDLLPLSGHGDDLLAQIHRLASHYHWSEPEIVALPRARRQRYLAMIDAARGWDA